MASVERPRVIDLACGSDLATFVIFDPGAALDLLNAEDDGDHDLEAGPSQDQLDDAVARGSLIAYSYGGDGAATFRLFVDQPVDPELERRGVETASGILRVPTGRLVATGAEDLVGSGVLVSAETFQPTTGTEHAIPAGNYAVTAYELAWGDEPDQAATAAAYAASPLGARLERVLAPVTGMLGIATLLGIFLAAIAVIFGDMTLRELVHLLVLVLPWLAVVWFGLIALWVISPARIASAARTIAYARFPCAVVHLHRLADTESLDGRAGCAFGTGAASPLPTATVVKS